MLFPNHSVSSEDHNISYTGPTLSINDLSLANEILKENGQKIFDGSGNEINRDKNEILYPS